MYIELGGYIGYQQTPIRELQEVRLSIIAELNYQAEQNKEIKRKQEEMERETERQRRSR
jgi:hypothetical protein